MKRDALIVLAWTAMLGCSALLHGQDGRVHLPDQPGVWRSTYKSTPADMPKASAAELAALRTALTGIEQVVHATPMLTAPRGFDVHVWQRLDRGCPKNPVLCRQAPLAGWIKFDFEWYEVRNGKVITLRSEVDVEPPNIDVAFNDPEATYVLHQAGNPEPTDPSGNKIVGPLVELERVGNVVIYDNGVVMLGRNPRPFFIPATREDYLLDIVKQFARKRDTARSGPDDIEKIFIDELAALSPEERRSQAYTGTGAQTASRLVPASEPGATPLNKFNPAYFDPALPRTAIQLITVRFTDLEQIRAALGDRPDLLERNPITPERIAFLAASGLNVASYRVFEVARLLDYSALAALLAAPAPPVR